MKLMGMMLVIFGVLGLISGEGVSSYEPIVIYAASIVTIGWGVLAILYAIRKYRGGFPSVLGGFLIGLGIFEVSKYFDPVAQEQTESSFVIIALFIILFIGGGGLLLKGHRDHKAKDGGFE